MNRREVIGSIATVLSFCSLRAQAQVTGKQFLIAVLLGGTDISTERYRRSFRRGLLELGYLEGSQYVIEERFAEGMPARFPALAEELVRLKPNAIVTSSTISTIAARAATYEIPIVSAVMGDAIGLGLIATQARPGGNVTGILVTDADLAAKQLAFARELIPGAKRIGVLINPSNPGTDVQRKGAESAAATLAIELAFAEAETLAAVDAGFVKLARAEVDVVFVIGDPLFFSERQQIAAAALAARLPTVYIWREHVEAGGLMSYGVDLKENYRRVAFFVDRILKGARPGDLPAELPTKFELIVNLNTAKTLGLTLPPSLLARADEVIE